MSRYVVTLEEICQWEIIVDAEDKEEAKEAALSEREQFPGDEPDRSFGVQIVDISEVS